MAGKMTYETGLDTDLAERLGKRSAALLGIAGLVVRRLTERNLYIATMESCTGGALADYITSISGSSSVLKDSFITYSNEAKIARGVPEAVIEEFTVYSSQTALAMARAARTTSVRADIGVGITGSLSRVDPANDNSIPGEVYLGLVYEDRTDMQELIIPETNRMEAKLSIVEYALSAIELITS
jgi:nicotinamide-nucleotide amidase